MAACLMFSGVGKSGSPAPKSTTSYPSDFNRAAAASTEAVELIEILEARVDSLMKQFRSRSAASPF